MTKIFIYNKGSKFTIYREREGFIYAVMSLNIKMYKQKFTGTKNQKHIRHQVDEFSQYNKNNKTICRNLQATSSGLIMLDTENLVILLQEILESWDNPRRGGRRRGWLNVDYNFLDPSVDNLQWICRKPLILPSFFFGLQP